MSATAGEASATGRTVAFKVHFRTGERGRRRLRAGGPPDIQPPERGRIPRVARLLALAIRFEGLIRQGVVKDRADLARLGGVSRARITQILDLLNLAPDIQEAILTLPRTRFGWDALTERGLRGVVAEVDWERQRQLWRGMTVDPPAAPTADVQRAG